MKSASGLLQELNSIYGRYLLSLPLFRLLECLGLLSTHRAPVPAGTALPFTWIMDWGLLFGLCLASWFLQMLDFCPCFSSTLNLERLSRRTLLLFNDPSSFPCCLETPFFSSGFQSLPGTRPELPLPSLDLGLIFYYAHFPHHNSVSICMSVSPLPNLICFHSTIVFLCEKNKSLWNSLRGSNEPMLTAYLALANDVEEKK